MWSKYINLLIQHIAASTLFLQTLLGVAIDQHKENILFLAKIAKLLCDSPFLRLVQMYLIANYCMLDSS